MRDHVSETRWRRAWSAYLVPCLLGSLWRYMLTNDRHEGVVVVNNFDRNMKFKVDGLFLHLDSR